MYVVLYVCLYSGFLASQLSRSNGTEKNSNKEKHIHNTFDQPIPSFHRSVQELFHFTSLNRDPLTLYRVIAPWHYELKEILAFFIAVLLKLIAENET